MASIITTRIIREITPLKLEGQNERGLSIGHQVDNTIRKAIERGDIVQTLAIHFDIEAGEWDEYAEPFRQSLMGVETTNEDKESLAVRPVKR